MSLVVFADDVDSLALKEVAKLTATLEISQITTRSFRLHGARPDPALAATCAAGGLDWLWLPAERRLQDYGLFVTDMDSTLINIECIDEIADMQGLKAEVAAITSAAMSGEIDFAESLKRRVELLAGLPESALAAVYEERLALNPGARRLLERLQAAGLRTMLVSGGFSYFTDRLQAELGFDYAWANVLEVVDGRLSGRVSGPVIDGAAKASHLLAVCAELGLQPAQVMAAGDGANDIPMLQAAGLSFAFHPKPALRAVADCSIEHSGLDAIVDIFPRP